MSPLETITQVPLENLFQRSLSAHMGAGRLEKLQQCSVLVAGLGGGSNIAELLARKGVGRIILADLDVYEVHNIRQRGSLMSTLGRSKTGVMRERLYDINPNLEIMTIEEGITESNVWTAVNQCDIIIDMLDFSAIKEKVALHREARAQGKYVLTAPSVVNGAVLYIFSPNGVPFETFFDIDLKLSIPELGLRFLKRLIPKFPEDAPEAMYKDAAQGRRTIPLDAVGVDQAAVMTVAALQNIVFERYHQVRCAPLGLMIDASNPLECMTLIDFSEDFEAVR